MQSAGEATHRLWIVQEVILARKMLEVVLKVVEVMPKVVEVVLEVLGRLEV